MPSPDPSPDCTYSELARIVDETCAPFETLDQVNRFLKAANMLWRREPSETGQDGVTASKRDLMTQIEKAEKVRETFLVGTRPATVIVPADCLR